MGFIEIREQNMAVCAGVFGGGGGSVCVWGGVTQQMQPFVDL